MKRVLQSRLNPPVKPEPEIIIKEIIKEVLVYQPPQIITKEVIKEVQSPHLIEEINRLTQRLADKDEIIRQMHFEKTELISKLNVSEVSKNALKDELTGLKEDKADLRVDKAKLHEEIALLRKSELINQEQFLQKTLELEQLNKMFNESSIANNSFIQDEKKEPIINNLEIPLLHMLNETVESIYPSNEKIELSGDELNSFSIID
jgi:predicted nuclease with TOPRIM domain